MPRARSPTSAPGCDPNVEAVLARHPDLVVLYASAENRVAAAAAAQRGDRGDRAPHGQARGFRAHEPRARPRGRRERQRGARRSTRCSARSRACARRLRRSIIPPCSGTCGIRRSTPSAPGSFLDELLTIAGGTNIYADRKEPSPQVSLEDIINAIRASFSRERPGSRRSRASRCGKACARCARDACSSSTRISSGDPSVRAGEAAVSIARLLHKGIAL